MLFGAARRVGSVCRQCESVCCCVAQPRAPERPVCVVTTSTVTHRRLNITHCVTSPVILQCNCPVIKPSCDDTLLDFIRSSHEWVHLSVCVTLNNRNPFIINYWLIITFSFYFIIFFYKQLISLFSPKNISCSKQKWCFLILPFCCEFLLQCVKLLCTHCV